MFHDVVRRLDRFDRWPYSWSVLAVTAIGFFFVFFDIEVIGFSLPVALKEFGEPASASSASVSASLIGYIVGASLNSYVSDRNGRRPALLLAVLLAGGGSLLTAFSVNYDMLAVTRFVSGLGIGAAISATTTYITELSPRKKRGKFVAGVTVAAFFGQASVPFVALAIIPGSEWGWRVLVAIPVVAIPPALLWYRKLPESPLWLEQKGRHDEADAVLEAAENRFGLAAPSTRPGIAKTARAASPDRGQWSRLLRPSASGKTTAEFFLIYFVNYSVTYTFLGLGVTIITAQGFSLIKTFQLTIAGAVGLVVGALLAARFADRWPRRYNLAAIGIVLLLSFVALAASPSTVTVAIFFFISHTFNGYSSSILYTYTAEQFPTSIRGRGVGLTQGWGHLGGAVGPLALGYVFFDVGFSAGWYTMAFLSGVFVLLVLAVGRRNGPSGARSSDPDAVRTPTEA